MTERPVIQSKYHSQIPSGRCPKAEIKEISDSGKEPASLVLQVNIEDQDHEVLLEIDAAKDFGMSGPAAVIELRKIRETLERLVKVLDSPETE